MDRERYLLFGVLAVQLNKLTPAQLVAGAGAWAASPGVPLHEHLIAQGAISREDSDLILSLVDTAVRAHEGNEGRALDSFGGHAQVGESFSHSIILAPDGGIRPASVETMQDLREMPTVKEAPGRYTQISEFGQGGMGRVLLIYDQHLGRDIALKELLPYVDTEDATLKPGTPVRNLMPLVHRFLQEARITGQLEHPSIVPVYEMGRRLDGKLYYTMKLVRGRTLGKILRESESLGGRLAFLPNYLDLCQAIAYAHNRRVIHRDIKPDNVMIGDFGETVVIDWGLAKVIDKDDVNADSLQRTIHALRLDDDVAAAETQYGLALGTPVYMAPEQARGELESVDERSDVYSLGAVLYELLTGVMPFHGRTAKDILRQVVNDRPRPIREIVPDAPPELIAICEKAIDPDRSRRYADGRELAGEIQRFQSGALVQAYSYKFSEHLKRFVGRHKAILGTGAVAAVSLLVVASVSYLRIVQERNTAVVARADERRQREAAERELYTSSLYLARQSVDVRRYDVALEALDRAPEALRNWEWGYYKRLCHLDDHTLTGHTGTIEDIEFSPDGKYLVSASDDGSAIIWEVRSGTVWKTLSGHTGQVRSARFSPDGRKVITASEDKTAKIWDVATGAALVTLTGHGLELRSAEFSPDGARAVTSSFDKTAKIWDVVSGKELKTLQGHSGEVWSACFSSDGARVLTVSEDSSAGLWNTETGERALVIKPSGQLEGAVLSRDGSRILTWSTPGEVEVWDSATGTSLVTIGVSPLSPKRARFSPDGSKIVAVFFQSPVAKLFDAATGKEIFVLNGHEDFVTDARFSLDGTKVATTSADRSTKVWDIASGKTLYTLLGHSAGTFLARFSPNGATLATAATDSVVKLWDAVNPKGAELARLPVDGGKLFRLSISSSGGHLLSVTVGGAVTAWNVATHKAEFTLSDSPDQILGAIYDARETRILTWSTRGVVCIWDAATGAKLRTLSAHTKKIERAVFSADGHRIVSASSDATAILWDADTGLPLKTFTGHGGIVNCVDISADNSKVLTSSDDRTARLWDSASGSETHVLAGHESRILLCAFAPDGARAVTASGDGTAKVWDANSGREIATLRGHRKEIMGAAFSPDKRHMATYSLDRTAIIWDLDAPAEGISLRGHNASLTGACFFPDGTRLATVALDGTAMVWDCLTGAPMAIIRTASKNAQAVVVGSPGDLLITAAGDSIQLWGGATD